jgi:hypothetical protein
MGTTGLQLPRTNSRGDECNTGPVHGVDGAQSRQATSPDEHVYKIGNFANRTVRISSSRRLGSFADTSL